MRKLFLYAALLLLTQCSKCKNDDPSPLERLPPATQTGANTFGCLVNGQPWTPQGNDGTANYTVSYDRFPDGGILNISTYKIYGQGATDFQTLSLWAKQITGIGSFSFLNTSSAIARFGDVKTNCIWRSADNTTTYRRGTLTITKLDLTAGIISGTFDFTLYKPGCDSIRVTHGRFDKKL
ncbi:DUF6252 family protein [Hymenobacter psychrotolerans]|uniref:Uncharacterized protein n=1 Tax=Hymenobacter psychrotolerans DSM 18569 TaxID=1121959 RepID=A0A1M6PJT9_9BACT|nr:DUF6252 family protein [Hymenobacter psychrotolerans]SHK08211.1 hypothetical protein SAMN02746009_00261 [Hymenobacter psychrotolerans DSM 18569]